MMRPLLLAAALALISCLVGGALATVETTCKSAQDKVSGVNYALCVEELSHHKGGGGTKGFAEAAAKRGANKAREAMERIVELVSDEGPKPELEQCDKLYDKINEDFAEAEHDTNAQDYDAGKKAAAEVADLAKQCDDALAAAGNAPSPLAQFSSQATDIATIYTAITDLI